MESIDKENTGKSRQEMKAEKAAKKLEKQEKRAQKIQAQSQKEEIKENENTEETNVVQAQSNVENTNTNRIKIQEEVKQQPHEEILPLSKIFELRPNLRKMFCLTSYEEIQKIRNEPTSESKIPSSHNYKNCQLHELHGRKQLELPQEANSKLTSKELLKLFNKYELSILSEELFIFLLKIGNNKLKRQKDFCEELITIFKNYVNKTDNKGHPHEYVKQLKKNFEKLSKLIKEVTLVVGGLENTLSYILRLLSELFAKAKDLTIPEVKTNIYEKLKEYVDERLIKARELLIKKGSTLIKNNDCILVYGLNYELRKIIAESVKEQINFSLVYIQKKGQESFEDIQLFSQLGINVTFTTIASISNIITKVSKIFLEAKSMLSNGNLLGDVGTALIANVASNIKKPVIAFSETFKFWDKIHIDSIHKENVFFQKENIDGVEINHLNLHYDITPANVIDMVVCEFGFLPPSSVKVILREYVNEVVEI